MEELEDMEEDMEDMEVMEEDGDEDWNYVMG
jgi:hypothetical protein